MSGSARENSTRTSSPSSQQSTGMASSDGGPSSVITSISPSQVSGSTSSAFNFSGSRTGFIPSFYDQEQPQSQMSWPSNIHQTSSSSWTLDDETTRHATRTGSSVQHSLDSNHHAPGGGDGMRCHAFFVYLFPISARLSSFTPSLRASSNACLVLQVLIDSNHPVQHPIGTSR